MTEEKKAPEQVEEAVKDAADSVAEKAKEEAAKAEEKAEEKIEEAKKDVKDKAEKKAEAVKAEAKKGKKWLVPVICVVLILAVVAVAFILGVTARGSAVDAYTAAQSAAKAGDKEAAQKSYEEAYNAAYGGPFSFIAKLLLDDGDEAKIQKAYIVNVLQPQNRAMDAADILNGENFLSAEDKAEIFKAFPGVALTQVGAVVTLGSYEQDPDNPGLEPLEWIVLDVDKKNGAALLITKDIVGYDETGWNKRGSEANTSYALSNLNSWCEVDFYIDLKGDPGFNGKVLTCNVTTEPSPQGVSSGDPVQAHAFAPSAAEIEKYLTGDLEQYRVAVTAKAAKQARNGTYWLRNAGEKEAFASGVDKTGTIQTGVSVSSNYGIRPMLWYDIGLSK